jgi:hypothetical protein
MTQSQGRTVVLLLIAVLLLQLAALAPGEAQPLLMWPAVLIAVARLAYVVLTMPTGRRGAARVGGSDHP